MCNKGLLKIQFFTGTFKRFCRNIPERMSCSKYFRSESNSEPPRWNIRWIFLRKTLHLKCSAEFEYHSADSKPLLTFSKSGTADFSLIRLLLAPSQNRQFQFSVISIFHKGATGVEIRSSLHKVTFCFIVNTFTNFN